MGNPTHREREAFAAMARDASPCQEESARAMAALAPQIGRAALELRERRMESRKLLWQSVALAGGMALFAAVALLGWQNLDYLLETPCRWGMAAGVLVAVLMLTCCLPLLGGQRKGVFKNE